MHINHKLFLSLTVIVLSMVGTTSSYAAKVKSHYAHVNVESARSPWFLGAGGGFSWINLNKNTSVPNGSLADPPSNLDSLTIHSPNEGTAQIMFGYRWQEQNPYLPYAQLFLQYRHYFKKDITGQVDQYSLPEFVNYNYRMGYSADLVTINGKFDFIQCSRVMPYVSAGGGLIVNNLSSYHETALSNVTARDNPGYQSSQKVNWAGTLGAGFDLIVTENTWITLGYEHVFQGSLKSGAGTGSWSQTALNFGNVKMDNVFLTLSTNLPQA